VGLTSINKVLYNAQNGKFAIPLFNVFEMQGADGIFDAINEKGAPTIVGVYGPLINERNASAFINYLISLYNQSDVPISLMLDHGSEAECRKAVDLGFTDIMFDGSELSIDENIRITKELASISHQKGISIEAELGHVGNADTYEVYGEKGFGFTDPQLVKQFVEETSVDFLAIAFGSAHGINRSIPKLNMSILWEIREQIDIPLVMHGGSGLTDQQFIDVIDQGICKINISSNLLEASRKAIVSQVENSNGDFFSIMSSVRLAYQRSCGFIFDLFRTSGRAQENII